MVGIPAPRLASSKIVYAVHTFFLDTGKLAIYSLDRRLQQASFIVGFYLLDMIFSPTRISKLKYPLDPSGKRIPQVLGSYDLPAGIGSRFTRGHQQERARDLPRCES